MSELRYAFDLYPRDDPRDGARILRFSDLEEAEWNAEANGTGSGVIILPGDSPDAASIDPRGLQYVRVVEIDPDDPDGATLSGFAERVVHGFFLDTGSFDALTEQNTKRLTFGGAGTLSYWARAVMAPHTYIHDVFTGQDPFDRTWRLDQQSTVFANGNYTGAMLWRVLYELSHFRSGATYTHKHADGVIYTDAHDDDRTESAVPDAVIDFTAFLDSNGNAWTEKVGEFRVSVLDNGLSVIRLLMELGAYVEMDPDTFETRAYQASSHRRDRTGAAWGASVIRFQSPTDGTLATGNILSDAKRALTAHIQRSTMWAGGGDDVYAKATGSFDIPWEGGLNSDANDLDALEVQADRQITARSDAGDTLRVRIVPIDDPTGGFYRPLHSTGVLLDDLATVHNGAGQWDFDEQTFPVAAVGAKLREGGDWDTFVDLGASFRPMEGRQFQVAALGSHTHPPNPRLCRDTAGGSEEETFARTIARDTDGDWGTSEILSVEWIEPFASYSNVVSVQDGYGVLWATDSGGAVGSAVQDLPLPLSAPIEILTKARFKTGANFAYDGGDSTSWHLDFELSSAGSLFSVFSVYPDWGDVPMTCALNVDTAAGSDSTNITTITDLPDDWFWLRMEADSAGVRARIWLDGTSEPGTWDAEVVGANLSYATRLRVTTPNFPFWVSPTGVFERFVEIDSIAILDGAGDSTCIHGGRLATSGDASVSCGKCVASGNHEHDYVAVGGTTGQVLKKASADDWDTTWGADATGAPTTANYLVGTANAGLSAEIPVGTTPGGELGGTWAAPTVDATHSGSTHASRAPSTANYLVGTADAGLSAEIAVGTTPGGELGGTWASPTVDATHSGSSHAGVVTTHEGAADPHTGYVREVDVNWVDLTDGGATALHTHAGGAHVHVYSEVPAGTIDGANAAFTIAATPTAGTLALYKNGLRQRAGAGNDYTLAAATITYEAGNIPQTGDSHVVDYLT